jgi:hypothetical protein
MSTLGRMSIFGTLRPDLNDRDEVVSIRSIQPEPMAAFHHPCLESRHSAFGRFR